MNGRPVLRLTPPHTARIGTAPFGASPSNAPIMAPAAAESSRRGRRRGRPDVGSDTLPTPRQPGAVRSGGRFVLVGLRLARRGEQRRRPAGRATGRSVGRPRCRSIRPMTAASSMSAPHRPRPAPAPASAGAVRSGQPVELPRLQVHWFLPLKLPVHRASPLRSNAQTLRAGLNRPPIRKVPSAAHLRLRTGARRCVTIRQRKTGRMLLLRWFIFRMRNPRCPLGSWQWSWATCRTASTS